MSVHFVVCLNIRAFGVSSLGGVSEYRAVGVSSLGGVSEY